MKGERGVPSLPSSSPVISFFCSRPYFLHELARKRLLRRLSILNLLSLFGFKAHYSVVRRTPNFSKRFFQVNKLKNEPKIPSYKAQPGFLAMFTFTSLKQHTFERH